ncbi:MAG: hypothetical protein N3F66_08440 [Spirochaetes bacterium]|nr:hypothetical protein [Spirochaetota bacterium]
MIRITIAIETAIAIPYITKLTIVTNNLNNSGIMKRKKMYSIAIIPAIINM